MKILFKLTFATLAAFALAGCNVSPSPSPNLEVKTYLTEGKTYSTTAEMVKAVKPSVVDVYSYNVNSVSCGSGVIVGETTDNNYYVITNHHVIDGGREFTITLYDENDNSSSLTAKLLGTSPKNDIAVLQVNSPTKLTVATFGESSSLQVGEGVIAIGNPLGILGGTVTHGIISSLEREMYLSELNSYMKLIQTNAAINNGNSGGALFSERGLLIGIVNSGYTSYQGLNFAIPSDNAKASFTSIVETYSNDHLGYVVGENNIGITYDLGTIYSDSSCSNQVEKVYVSSLSSTSCDAYKNNINDYARFINGYTKNFYTIEEINGVQITSSSIATKETASIKAGDTVTIKYRLALSTQRDFFHSAVYLSGDIQTLSFTASQYIYTIE